MAYEHMRVVGWYSAIPEIGAILFVAGWWARWRGSDLAEPTAQPSRWTFRSLMAVVSVTCCLLVLHLPRAARLFVDAARRMSKEEAARFPTTELQRLRALVYDDELAIRQWRALSRLEGAEQTAEDLGIGRMTIRQTFGRVLVPGIPELQRQSVRPRCSHCPTATGGGSIRPRCARACAGTCSLNPSSGLPG